ncbi:hypothetical protein [Paenibacillus chitinolyticus]|uniref:hypothetical protein n=1 Tax=Paenibacillus chitinolyticus TaxID=79263 RepID=UPI00367247E0
MGRNFANLHIKLNNLEKALEALKELSEVSSEVLGKKSSVQNRAVSDADKTGNEAQDNTFVFYVSKSNENWISVLHDYFVWGTVKKIGKALSRLIEEPVMTIGFINDEIFELSIFENGDIGAERIFCGPWTREDYELQEELLHDERLREVLGIRKEDFDEFIKITSPEQAVDRLSEFLSMSLWSDSEWLPHEESLRNRFGKYEFHIENT